MAHKVKTTISTDLMQHLARLGALQRLDDIETERRVIHQAFPDLAPDADARQAKMLRHMRKMRAAKARRDAQ